MGSFKWLHLSDFHFRMCEGFDMALILNRLKMILKDEADNQKFRYIFLTGDIADGNNYSMVEQRIRELLLDTDILDESGKIFWVCGNHDIPRTLKHREQVIKSIRSKEEKGIDFESEFMNEESKSLLLRAFEGYYSERKLLFGIDNAEYPHQVVHTDDAEILMLNTCLTSCDDDDEHKLYLCEPKLIELFHEIEPGKPVFVLGHHSLDFFADSEKRKLLTLFQEKNVSAYFCGHSHQLGVQPLCENIWEVVSGGFKIDGYAIISFFVGSFNEELAEYELIPYTYRSGSMNWDVDYRAVQGMKEGKKYKVSLPEVDSRDELSNIINQSNKLLQKFTRTKDIDVSRLNQVGERLLHIYVQTLLGTDEIKQMDFSALCNAAIQNGHKKINYSSFRMKDTMKDIWRFRENLALLLYELGRTDIISPIKEEHVFDFNAFFETVNRFDVTENTYVLATDAIHDMNSEGKRALTEFYWDMVLDYDGYSEKGGLRGFTSGQSIKDLVGDHKIIRESILRKEITSWIRIGEQMNFSLDSKSDMNLRKMKTLFEELIKKLYDNTNGMLILVFIKDIEVWDKEFMRLIWERFGERARFVMVGAYDAQKLDEQFQNIFLDFYGNPLKNCYEIFQTSMGQFLKKYGEHSDNFLEKKKHKNMSFPSNNGSVKLEQNLYINLSDFFEVLTTDIGVDSKSRKEDIEKFYLGGEAAWSLFYTKNIIELMEPDIIDEFINRLKTALGAKQEQPRSAIFYLLHAAGFGGTTTARAIAWRMHNECPTLILKNYESGKIKPLIQNLYDNHSRKGILVIADESRFSISDLENLEWEMGLVDRPFALLIAKRIEGKVGKISKNVRILNSLSNRIFSSLKSRFNEQSHLSAEILQEKNKHSKEIFHKNSEMRCPFLIGLYYQDEQFNGISEYVERIVRKVDSENELKLLYVLAIINVYGRIGVAKEIVRKYISLSTNSDYLEKYPYAKDAFIGIYDETQQIKVYREKHLLISKELMKQCSEKLYHSKYEESLKTVTQELVGKILEINSVGITLYYKNLLERLFIYKNATDVDEKGYTNVMDFSPLILALPSQSSKEDVMCNLAESVKKVVDQMSVEGNTQYFRMAAHICGHLGRLYKATMISSQFMENNQKSVKWCEIAESIMNCGQFEDAYIYHMYGTSLSKQCKDKLDIWRDEIDTCSVDEISKLETNMTKALKKFDAAICAGEFVRGCISKLSLLMEYMQFLMKWKDIKSADEMNRLSDTEREYIKDIDDILTMLEEAELDAKDRGRLTCLKSKFKSEIMFNNYGKAIEYYTNSIANVIKIKGEDAEELYVLRSGLASAILGKYYQNKQNPYLEMLSNDVERILDALEKNIFSTVVLSNWWEQQRRCNDCQRWLKVAKQSTIPVQTGIKVAEKWKELQKEIRIADPRPYYYLAVLHYLNALDGYTASLNIAQVNHSEAYKISHNNSNFQIIKVDKIRDILFEGKGMNRIKSVYNLSEILEKDSNNLVKIKGKFLDIDQDKNAKIGIIRVAFPQELGNAKIYFRMGDKNTISINQTTHTLEFGVGFTFERLEAINSTVNDITPTTNHKQ